MKIETEEEYLKILNEINVLLDKKELSLKDEKRLDNLADLIIEYEEIHYPMK